MFPTTHTKKKPSQVSRRTRANCFPQLLPHFQAKKVVYTSRKRERRKERKGDPHEERRGPHVLNSPWGSPRVGKGRGVGPGRGVCSRRCGLSVRSSRVVVAHHAVARLYHGLLDFLPYVKEAFLKPQKMGGEGG